MVVVDPIRGLLKREKISKSFKLLMTGILFICFLFKTTNLVCGQYWAIIKQCYSHA